MLGTLIGGPWVVASDDPSPDTTGRPAEPPSSQVSLLADLPAEVRRALSELDEQDEQDRPISDRSPAEQLAIIKQVSTPYEFDMGVLTAYSDPRWFATLVPGDVGTPVLELRRWPGDTILSIYALDGPFSSKAGRRPPVPDSEWTLAPGASEFSEEWTGVLKTEGGERPAVWREIRVADKGPVLGALLLPGDAGLGAEAIPSLFEELRFLQESILVRTDIWRRKAGLPAGQSVVLGALGAPPGDKDEAIDPWQVMQGATFTLGLPPGVLARRTDAGVPPPVAVPGGRLWIRGRFTDIEGQRVVIGDTDVVGYLAETETVDEDWQAGKQAPLGAPNAQRLAGQKFALLDDRTGAKGSRVERWKDPEFDGEWMVFRMPFANRGVEIGLPVLEGRQSMSLYWIPASWRGPGEAPAAPPVDPAERFGIKFERLGRLDRQERPWMEGYLTVPGLRVELPIGWWPAASLRSKAGYPIRLLDGTGETLGQFRLIEPDDVAATVEGWDDVPRPGVHRAEKVWRHPESGSRLFVGADGVGKLFEIYPGAEVSAETWDRMLASVQLMRPDT